MVNKQYNVQSLNKNKSNNNNNHNNHNHTSSITLISTVPPNLNSQQQLSQPQQSLNNNNNLANNNDRHQSPIISAFEHNITQQYFHHSDTYDLVDGTDNIIDSSDIDPIASINSSVIGDSHKQLSINDIGRFQYILQMDREMVSLEKTKSTPFFSLYRSLSLSHSFFLPRLLIRFWCRFSRLNSAHSNFQSNYDFFCVIIISFHN